MASESPARVYPFLEQNSRLFHFVESKYFTITMLIVVLSNTCVMIAETYDYYYHRYNTFFLLIEKIYLMIYIVECSLKFWVESRAIRREGLTRIFFFRFIHGNIFEIFGIVLICLSLL